MTSIGQILADARRKRKVTVKDAEKAIKIRAKYISALEQDAFDQISGEAYVIGFLKTYAQWLEIDPRPLIDSYREQAGVAHKLNQSSPELAPITAAPNAKKLIALALIAVVAVLVIAKLIMAIMPMLQTGR